LDAADGHHARLVTDYKLDFSWAITSNVQRLLTLYRERYLSVNACHFYQLAGAVGRL